jgi:hydrogenase maturation protein HypF
MTTAVVRERLRVHGVVQGVGFRPFVHTVATELGLAGWVGNDAAGVLLELEGAPAAIAELHRRLVADAPRLAVVDELVAEPLQVCGASGFVIRPSEETGGSATAMVPPDVAACEACLAEIAEPTDRRYRYPFGNCTDCGPRLSVITATPYDRARTTMAGFTLCPECAAERADPGDRRFHAEPTACPRCGPTLTLGGLHGEDALSEARRLLAAGAVVAVKGLGGYHLACDAADELAVAQLRRRKDRPHKPFALLVADLEAARTLAHVDAAEATALSSPARPIVLLRARPDAPVAPSVAPRLDELGVQLPSTPLHVLLLGVPGDAPGPRALVLTSGNLSDEPIAFTDTDACTRLAAQADAFLTHDRPIHLPVDDSVVRVVDGTPIVLRRSRGYAPLPVRLSRAVRPVLAVGGDLKAAVCLAAGTDAWPGPHVGEAGSVEGAAALARSAHHLVDLLRVRPEVVACDTHPGYVSARLAQELAAHWGVPLIRVQHHHAHVASALAEQRVDAPAVGVALDGTGYGCDTTMWGGELLVVHPDGTARRVGHLRPVLLPGGDAAVRRPARSALAHLHAAGVPWTADLAPVAACTEVELGVVARQLETGFGCTATSSGGRLFDAVAALCGVRQDVTYEAQAVLELEALSRREQPPTYAFDIDGGLFDAAPVVRAVVADLRAGVAPGVVGARFSASLAALVVEVAAAAAHAEGLDIVALSGGCFAGTALLRATRAGLARHGLRVVTHQHLPCGDGGLSLGQAVVAGVLPPPPEEQSCV